MHVSATSIRSLSASLFSSLRDPRPDPHPRPLHPQVLGSLSSDMCEQRDVVTSPSDPHPPDISPLRCSRVSGEREEGD
ncbi:hypothetical protein CesoFtcFv8_005872 [Champsocephalus esox]|uniref:Uncharacterized protein n=1 Tax=Champsocephalus esox TaxID=159716 RepID=A0AAN8H6A6_9TELE|nr:hypothetical protein CesoFtcFv8_005872 [Champsocephalus esox]